MSDYEDLLPELNATVDETLGDTIFYRAEGEPEFVETSAFILDYEPPLGGDAVDHLQWRARLKIAISFLPEVSLEDRFHAARLGGEDNIWSPGSDMPAQDGRYWVFDIQASEDA